MKNIFAILVALLISFQLSAQVGIGTSSPHTTAQLEIQSDTKGILIPRMLSTARTTMVNPAEGLLVYQTDGMPGFYYYNGTSWKVVGAQTAGFAATTGGKSATSSTAISEYWTLTSGSGFDNTSGTYTVPFAGKYLVTVTILFAHDSPATSSMSGNPPYFEVQNNTSSLLKGFIPMFDVDVPLLLTLKTPLRSGTVSFSGVVTLNVGNELQLYYNAGGNTQTINIGGNDLAGVNWTVSKID